MSVSAAVSATVDADPQRTWDVLSDLDRFGEWLQLHAAWPEGTPDVIAPGVRVRETMTVLGLPIPVAWTVGTWDPPRALSITGTAVIGVRADVTLAVAPDGATGARSSVTASVALEGQLVTGPIGDVLQADVARALDASVAPLRRLLGGPGEG